MSLTTYYISINNLVYMNLYVVTCLIYSYSNLLFTYYNKLLVVSSNL